MDLSSAERVFGKDQLKRCARSCAPLRNFLRTRLEGLINLAFSFARGLFTEIVAQLLAHQGHEPSPRQWAQRTALSEGQTQRRDH